MSQTTFFPLSAPSGLYYSPLHMLQQVLDSYYAAIPLENLNRLLHNTRLTTDDLARYCQFHDRHYTRNLIRRNAHYELLCLCWKSGQRSRIHDHYRSNCAVRVLRGIMTNTHFDLLPSGHIMATGSEDMRAGTVEAHAPSVIHQVGNLQPANEDLITLHIYSPPLSCMNVFSIDPLAPSPTLQPVAFGTDGDGI